MRTTFSEAKINKSLWISLNGEETSIWSLHLSYRRLVISISETKLVGQQENLCYIVPIVIILNQNQAKATQISEMTNEYQSTSGYVKSMRTIVLTPQTLSDVGEDVDDVGNQPHPQIV